MLARIAERVCLAIMRDAAQDPELRLSAAHVAIVLEHMERQERDALDVHALQTPMQEVNRG